MIQENLDSDLEEPGFCSRKTWIKIQKNQDSDPGKPKFRSRKIEFRSRKIRIQIHENLDQTEKTEHLSKFVYILDDEEDVQ